MLRLNTDMALTVKPGQFDVSLITTLYTELLLGHKSLRPAESKVKLGLCKVTKSKDVSVRLLRVGVT